LRERYPKKNILPARPSKRLRTGTSQDIIMNPELQDQQSPLIYLNNAATTWPKPAEVLEEVAVCLRHPLHEPGRTTGNGSLDYLEIFAEPEMKNKVRNSNST